MNQELDDIKQYALRLRADLAATNTALTSLLLSLTEQQQHHALETFARRSAEKQRFVESRPTAEEQDTLQPLLAAEERLYQSLQLAQKQAKKT